MKIQVRTHIRKNKRGKTIVRRHARKIRRKYREQIDWDDFIKQNYLQKAKQKTEPKPIKRATRVAAESSLPFKQPCEWCGTKTNRIIKGRIACDENCRHDMGVAEKI